MTALHNISVLCPAFATILINRVPVNLLVAGGGRLVSKEGTTQGDPLAMGMHALGIQPLLNRLEGLARQVWYADDATGAGSLAQVRDWWSGIVTRGPAYGYEANANKTWLIVKEDDSDRATLMFANTCRSPNRKARQTTPSSLGQFLKSTLE